MIKIERTSSIAYEVRIIPSGNNYVVLYCDKNGDVIREETFASLDSTLISILRKEIK